MSIDDNIYTMSRKNTETRNRILKSTLTLLEKGDGKKTRMADIAKQADLSRQAVYLHFENRAELLIATTHYVDEFNKIDEKLAKSRQAKDGIERLNAYIDAWGNYIPIIYNVAKALLAMQEQDEEAKAAWNDRMNAMRQGCEAIVLMLEKEGKLTKGYTVKQTTDILWTLLSIRNWEQLVGECGFSQEEYIGVMKEMGQNILNVK